MFSRVVELCVAVCCSVLRSVAVDERGAMWQKSAQDVKKLCGSVFHYVAECWSEWARGTLQRKTRQGCGQME